MTTVKFNIDLINRRLGEMQTSLEGLKTLASLSKEHFLSDPHAPDAAKYKLLLAIEASLSLCNHINARISRKVPETYADCFLMLKDPKVISLGSCRPSGKNGKVEKYARSCLLGSG